MKKPFKVVIEAFVMADDVANAEEIAEELIDDSDIEECQYCQIFDEDEEELELRYEVIELTIDEVNELFRDQRNS